MTRRDRVRVLVAAIEPFAWGRTAALLAIGCLALTAGVLVYLTDRQASHAPLMPAVTALSGRHLFGALGGWLPSFVHPLSFSLFSAALLAPGRRREYGACAFWFAVNAAFEIGQHPQVNRPLADALQDVLGQGSFARALQSYFLRGTFDPGDLIAAAFGSAVAAWLLRRLRATQGNCHAL